MRDTEVFSILSRRLSKDVVENLYHLDRNKRVYVEFNEGKNSFHVSANAFGTIQVVDVYWPGEWFKLPKGTFHRFRGRDLLKLWKSQEEMGLEAPKPRGLVIQKYSPVGL